MLERVCCSRLEKEQVENDENDEVQIDGSWWYL